MTATPAPNLTAKQQAVLALRLEANRPRVGEPIAIVGMACRFPGGGDSPAAFWSVLLMVTELAVILLEAARFRTPRARG